MTCFPPSRAPNPVVDLRSPDTRPLSRQQSVVIGAIVFTAMLPVTMLVSPLKELIAARFPSSALSAHLFMSVNMLGAVLAAPLMAALADLRRRRKRVAAAALAADGCLLAVMKFLPSLGALLSVRFLEGVAHLLALSTLMGIAAGGATERGRGRMMGLIGACMMFGTACGTQLGGGLWRVSGTRIFLVAGGVSILAAGAAALLIREPRHEMARGSRMGTWALLRSMPRLGVAYGFAFVDRFCVGVVITTFVLFLADVHGFSPSARGMLLGLCFMTPFALCVYPAGRLVDRVGRVTPIVAGSVAFGLLFASYGFVPRDWMWLVMLGSGLLSAVIFAPNLALCADLAPAAQRGTAFTGFNAAGSLGFVAGPLAGGAVHALCRGSMSDVDAYRITLAAAGGVVIVWALLSLPVLLRLRRSGIIQ